MSSGGPTLGIRRRWQVHAGLVLLLVGAGCGSSTAETTTTTIVPTTMTGMTTETPATQTTTTAEAPTTTTEATTTTLQVAAPDAVWTELVQALNGGDLEALRGLVAAEIEWSYSNMLGIHHQASGSDEAMRGFEGLIERGVTYESEILEVAGEVLEARTVFIEPGLAELLGGRTLLQTDIVTITGGMITTWVSTANETIPIEE